MRNYKATKTSTKDVTNMISKFHKSVDQGPLYVCTCCDQLWYRHSVVNANKLRKSNYYIKYLCDK